LIFSFFEFKFKFEFGGGSTAGYRYRTPAVTAVTAVYRAVPSGKKTLPVGIKKPWVSNGQHGKGGVGLKWTFSCSCEMDETLKKSKMQDCQDTDNFEIRLILPPVW
jgi:hypothetical protein